MEDRLVPSTLTVTSAEDSGAGSLRAAIAAANSGDTINFNPSLAWQTVRLTSGELAINESLDIEGLGADQLTISGTNISRVFDINASSADVTIAGLTVANGAAGHGGAIYNAGTLTISNSTLANNVAEIDSPGTVVPSGGAIYNIGALTVSNSTLCVNAAGSDFNDAVGGAIYNAGALTISNSTLDSNSVMSCYSGSDYGGAIYNAGALTVSNSELAGNFAHSAYSGAYCAYGEAYGGAICNTASLTISHSTLAINVAESDSWNAYGGGLESSGTASIDHSTLASNQAYAESLAGEVFGYGGGISSTGPASGLQVYDTIVADNSVYYYGYGPDLDGSFTSLGHNLIGNSAGGTGFAASDLLDLDPQLGPLQDNGGPTQTVALLFGSPAVNAGDNTDAPAYDQRGPGFPRVFGGTIDIGAFEVQNLTELSVSGFPSVITAGNAGSFTVTAINFDGTTDTGYTGTVHFTSSDGQAVLPADYTFTPADAGVHTFSAILKTAGSQAITATDTATNAVTGTDGGITVNPAAASKMTVADFPSRWTAGVAGNFTVTLTDSYGNIATSYAGTVHLTSSDARAILPANYTFTANDAGSHTFSATLKTAGTQSITAKDTMTDSLNSTESGITVNPAAASKFIISAPASVNAGVPFSLTLTVEDAYGNVVTGYTGTVHFSSSEQRATLPSNYVFKASDKGVHTFTGLVLHKKGSQTITIKDTQNSSIAGSAIVDVL
jgi:hypothetical protein